MQQSFPRNVYKGLQGVCAVSCATGAGMTKLQRDIADLAQQKTFQPIVAQSWVQLYDRVCNRDDNRVHWSEFYRWAIECGVRPAEVPAATQFLCDIGVLVHFGKREPVDLESAATTTSTAATGTTTSTNTTTSSSAMTPTLAALQQELKRLQTANSRLEMQLNEHLTSQLVKDKTIATQTKQLSDAKAKERKLSRKLEQEREDTKTRIADLTVLYEQQLAEKDSLIAFLQSQLGQHR